MCGIVGAVAERNVTPILLEGLRRLEYRGYDSAGIACLNETGELIRHAEVGKVATMVKTLVRRVEAMVERAAIDAAVGLKLHPDFDSAIREMTRVTDTFEPIPRNRDLYHELYERVYRKLYRRLKPIYNDIRAITGYPAM